MPPQTEVLKVPQTRSNTGFWQPKPSGCKDVVWRYDGNPIVGRGHFPGVLGIFNSAVVPFQGMYAGVFRVETKRRYPQLHVGFSHDGREWDIERRPLRFTEDPEKRPQHEYAYDPRITEIDGSYYLTWCAGHQGPSIGLAKTDDFVTFERFENATLPFNRNGVLFPRKIGGEYWMLTRPSDDGHTPFGDIYVSRSKDMVYWGRHRVVLRRGGMEHGIWWQVTKVGAGPTPIETPDGWLLLYHGVMDTCDGFEYSMGAALLDLDNPARVTHRKADLLLAPERDYEINGHVDNVVFPCAAYVDASSIEGSGRKLVIYYGAADTSTCVAFADLDELVEAVKEDSVLF